MRQCSLVSVWTVELCRSRGRTGQVSASSFVVLPSPPSPSAAAPSAVCTKGSLAELSVGCWLRFLLLKPVCTSLQEVAGKVSHCCCCSWLLRHPDSSSGLSQHLLWELWYCIILLLLFFIISRSVCQSCWWRDPSPVDHPLRLAGAVPMAVAIRSDSDSCLLA